MNLLYYFHLSRETNRAVAGWEYGIKEVCVFIRRELSEYFYADGNDFVCTENLIMEISENS